MSRRKKKTLNGICPVCVEEKALTKDHTPPKGVFLKPRPTNTITVWTCKDCNGGSSLDDEYFRIYIASNAEPGSHLFRLWKGKVVKSTFERSPALREALRAAMDQIREHHKGEPLRDFDDRVLTAKEVENVLPLEKERIDRVVHKIVRCLHSIHVGTPLPVTAQLETSVEPLTQVEIESLVRNRTGMVGGKNGEFIYRKLTENNRDSWILYFYLTHEFRIRVNAT